MARKPKSVYEWINEKENKIRQTEELLDKLNEELQALYFEKEELETKNFLM